MTRFKIGAVLVAASTVLLGIVVMTTLQESQMEIFKTTQFGANSANYPEPTFTLHFSSHAMISLQWLAVALSLVSIIVLATRKYAAWSSLPLFALAFTWLATGATFNNNLNDTAHTMWLPIALIAVGVAFAPKVLEALPIGFFRRSSIPDSMPAGTVIEKVTPQSSAERSLFD